MTDLAFLQKIVKVINRTVKTKKYGVSYYNNVPDTFVFLEVDEYLENIRMIRYGDGQQMREFLMGFLTCAEEI